MSSFGDAEPAIGTREEAVKAFLKAAYRGAGSVAMTNRSASETGRCLSERFTSHLEVLAWVKEPYLTARQVQIVELIFRDDLLVDEVAQRLRLGRSTVSRDKHDAMQTLIRIAFNDPGYVLPYRVYHRREPGDEVA